jgi:hypothetical protein
MILEHDYAGWESCLAALLQHRVVAASFSEAPLSEVATSFLQQVGEGIFWH